MRYYGSAEASRWEPAGINRAAKAVQAMQSGRIPGRTPSLPRTDRVLSEACHGGGSGLVWQEYGRQLKAQAWAPGPYVHSYWLKVWEGSAWFPGELRLAMADADGRLSLQSDRPYNARGDRAHRSDGQACYGGRNSEHGWIPCAGCAADRAIEHAAA